MADPSETMLPSDAALPWQIKITLRIVLAENDVSSLDPPPPAYFQISRQTYLHALLPQIKPLWQHLLPPGEHTPWFSYNSLPLKWNVPLGVLYDLLVPEHSMAPWPLVVHFTTFPHQTLPLYAGISSLQDSLRNSLKEAAFIACGSARRVMDMVPQSREDLWAAVSIADSEQYQRIIHSLPLKSPDSLQAVPVRVYIRPNAGESGGYLSSYETILQTSRPLPVGISSSSGSIAAAEPVEKQEESEPTEVQADVNMKIGEGRKEENGELMSIRAALAPIIRSWLNSQKEAKESGGSESDVWDAVEKAYVGGIIPPAEVPLVKLHGAFHAPDFFLYVVLHMKSFR